MRRKLFVSILILGFSHLGAAANLLTIQNWCPYPIFAAIAEPRERPMPTQPTLGFEKDYYFVWGWIPIGANSEVNAKVRPSSQEVHVLLTKKGSRTIETRDQFTHCATNDKFKIEWEGKNEKGEPKACPAGTKPQSGFQRASLNQAYEGIYMLNNCDGDPKETVNRLPWCAISSTDTSAVWIQHRQKDTLETVCSGIRKFFQEKTGSFPDHISKGYFSTNQQNTVRIDCPFYQSTVSGFGHEVWEKAAKAAEASGSRACHFWLD